MTKKITHTLLLSFSFSTAVFGQSSLKSNVHIGLTYPISTNGIHAAQYTNGCSMHAIAGVSHSEKAFCVAGVASIVKDSANGLLASGVANITGNVATGLQAAGFINYCRNYSKGMQAAGFINISGAMAGVQTAGFANITTHGMNGVQAAGFINVARVAKIDTTILANTTDSSQTHVAGYANFTMSKRMKGVQVAGFANVANDIDGDQIGGFINVARKVKGVQVAGFINVADSSDYPIGLVNIVKNGEKYIGIMVDETGTTFATFRSGGRILYGIVGVGFNGSKFRAIYATRGGIGAHLPITRNFRINGEVGATSFSDFRRSTDMEAGIRVLPSFKFHGLEVFAGPSFNYAMSFASSPFDHNSIWTDKNNCRIHELYIGAEAGIQLKF